MARMFAYWRAKVNIPEVLLLEVLLRNRGVVG